MDDRTDLCYVMLDIPYESNANGKEWGSYTSERTGSVTTFYVIPDMDSALYLTDAYRNVYYAGDETVDAATWRIGRMLFCDEQVLSLERFRYEDEGAGNTMLTELRDLWFDGETEELPIVPHKYYYAVKLQAAAYQGISYAITCRVYADHSIYLADKPGNRAVRVPGELAESLLARILLDRRE